MKSFQGEIYYYVCGYNIIISLGLSLRYYDNSALRYRYRGERDRERGREGGRRRDLLVWT